MGFIMTCLYVGIMYFGYICLPLEKSVLKKLLKMVPHSYPMLKA